MRDRAFDVVAAVADHEHPLGQRLQLRQRVREHVGLGGASAVDTGAGDHLEVLVEAEVGQDALRGGLALEVATARRTPAARRSASSGAIPSKRLLMAQPRVL